MNKKYCLILLFLSILSFFPNLWILEADLMEARNFITAREIVESGNWLVTTLNGNLRFEKPPLPTWLTALVMKVTGNFSNEFLLRVPVALISILLIFFIYHLVKTLTKKSFLSFIISFVATTTFMIVKIGNENSWDMYAYVFIFGAIDFIVYGMKNHKLGSFFLGGVFLGASILSKGPVAIYGMFLPFIIAYGHIYSWKNFRENYRGLILTLGVGLLLPLLWGGVIFIKYGDIFLKVLEKERDTWTSRHSRGIFYYLDYFLYTGIWIFFSFAGIVKRWSKERVEDRKFFDFAFLWNTLIIIFLSLIKMKKKRYGIPIYITSSFLIGSICEYYYFKSWEMLKKTDRVLLQLQNILLWGISLGIPLLLFTLGYLKENLSLNYIILVLIFLFPFWYWLYIKGKGEDKIKTIIIGSGILMLIANNSCNWFIEVNLRDRRDKNYQKLRDAKKSPLEYEVYSEDFEIEDVWNVGRKIIPLEEESRLPERLILLGEEGIDNERLKEYEILKKQTFTKGRKYVNLYWLKKMEDRDEGIGNRNSGVHRLTFNRGAIETGR